MGKVNFPEKEKWLEILAVLLTGILKFVLMDEFGFRLLFITGACLFWLLFILTKYIKNPKVLSRWGFRKHDFRKSMLALLPYALIFVAGIIIYGLASGSAIVNWHIIPVLIFYPIWGTIQQFMTAGLVAGNLKTISTIKISDSQIGLLTALLFSLVHYPSVPLMLYTFIMEYIFIRVYFKWGNLWSLGLYHGLVSGIFLSFVSGRDLWNELLGSSAFSFLH
ncbi:MAG: CPBP family intramembrane metalloprotease [Bacteroidetes bacterium]|nr:CPBP family intramembrane metalloprotease [Bacteroidota bacterium]